MIVYLVVDYREMIIWGVYRNKEDAVAENKKRKMQCDIEEFELD